MNLEPTEPANFLSNTQRDVVINRTYSFLLKPHPEYDAILVEIENAPWGIWEPQRGFRWINDNGKEFAQDVQSELAVSCMKLLYELLNSKQQ